MIEPDLRDKIMQTATKVEGIENSQTAIKEGQTRIWSAIDDLRGDVQETKLAIAKLNWLPSAVGAIITAIVARALWIISGVGR